MGAAHVVVARVARAINVCMMLDGQRWRRRYWDAAASASAAAWLVIPSARSGASPVDGYRERSWIPRVGPASVTWALEKKDQSRAWLKAVIAKHNSGVCASQKHQSSQKTCAKGSSRLRRAVASRQRCAHLLEHSEDARLRARGGLGQLHSSAYLTHTPPRRS